MQVDVMNLFLTLSGVQSWAFGRSIRRQYLEGSPYGVPGKVFLSLLRVTHRGGPWQLDLSAPED